MPSARDRERILKLLLIAVVGLPFVLLLKMQPDSVTPKIKESKEAKSPTESSPTTTQTPVSSPPSQEQTVTEPAPPVVDLLLAESRQKVKQARDAFQMVRGRTESDLLAKFGGTEWQRTQELIQQAELSTQPSTAIAFWQQAKEQLVALLPQIDTRQKIAQLRSLEAAGDDQAFLTALREVSSRQPTDFDSLWQQVETWTEARWFALCHTEIQRLSPDDSGFSEIWLALADYHKLHGDSAAAREALDRAWSSIPRMTNAVRAAESGFECLRRLSETPSAQVPPENFSAVAKLVHQIRDGVRRAELLADLAGLAQLQGDLARAAQYLRDGENALKGVRGGLVEYLPKINRCRAMACFAPPDQIFDVCQGIPKYNGAIGDAPFPANTMAFAHAAMAGVRTKDQAAIWRGLLLAEAQQLDASDNDLANVAARHRLAQVDLAQEQWQRAVITASNLSDLSLRASILYSVMQAAPTEVPQEMGLGIITLRPTDRGVVPAIAAYLPHCFAGDRSMSDWLDWIGKLPNSSARAAAYLALARQAVAPSKRSVAAPLPQIEPNMDDPRSLMEAAEVSANLLQDPLSRAYAQLWIAICWQQQQNPAGYTRACDQLHRELFQAWQRLWQAQSPTVITEDNQRNAQRANSGFKKSGRNDQELARQQQQMVECYALLAEAQGYHLHDPRRAIESVLETARSSHLLVAAKPELRIRLRSIVEAVHQDCELPTGLMDSAIDPVNNYLRMILATSTTDLAVLKKQVQVIESAGPGYGYTPVDCLARGYAEIALMAAKQGQIDDYRAARRTANSLIETQSANSSIRLPLWEADAYAGELELALSAKRTHERLPLYGTESRPLSTLCVELCRANRLADAEPLLAAIKEPYWKLRAMHAIAAARLQSLPTSKPLDWVMTLDDPLLRVAAYCGLALRETRLW